MKMSLIFLLISSAAYAENYRTLLTEIGLRKQDVVVSQRTVADANEGPDTTQTNLSLKKEARFRGLTLKAGSEFRHNSKGGLRSMTGVDKDYLIEGFHCGNLLHFNNNNFCSCTLARPYRVSDSIEVPIGSVIRVEKNKINLFILPEARGVGLSLPPKIGGTSVAAAHTYEILDGRIVEHEGTLESLCED